MSPEFDHTEFEQWLRQETDRHRLYADESVWDRIQRRVHKRRWFPFVLTALLTISASVTWVMIDQPDLPLNYTATTTEKRQSNDQVNKQEQSIAYKKFPTGSTLQPRLTNTSPEPLSFLMHGQTDKAQPTAEPVSDPPIAGMNTEAMIERIAPEAKKIIFDFPKAKNQVRQQPPPFHSTYVAVMTPVDPTMESPKIEPEAADNEKINLLLPEQYESIESVINAYKGKRTKKSWRVQLSVSPTISYRQLIENTSALQAARSVMNAAPAMAVPELESVVNHKPDLGLQFGVSVNRQLTKRLDFVGGVQFNINKYDIRAYRGGREVATVGLNNEGGTGSVSSYTNYRSSGGVWGKWLANYYFTASAPIGFQYRVAGNKKWNWGVGSTIQPTYILSNQAYMLSADYKNYLEVPSLVRRWNVNGQFETFIGFQKGKTRWTLGPQARYQILSSYEKAYPVQEHLFDIGIKLGVGL